ncbi:hypothetical protein C8Q75DRAFT_437258 [Abortiporus biennis]|nr:hypothetical protein C8Q75DRAFT_437258 [Abortiporus biennis]
MIQMGSKTSEIMTLIPGISAWQRLSPYFRSFISYSLFSAGSLSSSYSSSTMSSCASTLPASTRTMKQTNKSTPAIASLPSFAHSLSSFPNMTSVANDMVHYGTMGRTKNLSEAKLNIALETARQRRDNSTLSGKDLSSTTIFSDFGVSSQTDDENVLVIPRKKNKIPRKDAV